MKKDKIKTTPKGKWKYPKSGKWIKVNAITWQKCCDCGLVHRWENRLKFLKKTKQYQLESRWFRGF